MHASFHSPLILFLLLLLSLAFHPDAGVVKESDIDLADSGSTVVLRPDTVPKFIKDTVRHVVRGKFSLGLNLDYPYVYGGDSYFLNFWQTCWHGLLGLSGDFEFPMTKRLTIGPVIEISCFQENAVPYGTTYRGLPFVHEKGTFFMTIVGFLAKYDCPITPNQSLVITPVVNLGMAANSFYMGYGQNASGEWSTDLGLAAGLGVSARFCFTNDFDIGPFLRYNFIRRLYDTSTGKTMDGGWINTINVLHFGLTINLPVGKSKAGN
jgi:hypothetical protein